MAKQFKLPIDRHQTRDLLRPVRAKRDVIIIWMNAIKAFLANQPADPANSEAELTIVVKTMSRLFVRLGAGNKIHSLAFPFGVTKLNDEFTFQSRERIAIDSKTSSQILSLIENSQSGVLAASNVLDFAEPIMQATDENSQIWILLRELLLEEDGYIRYDHDRENEDGDIHPLNHLDLGYSPSGSFKLGLKKPADHALLVDILNVDCACHYLLSASEAAGLDTSYRR